MALNILQHNVLYGLDLFGGRILKNFEKWYLI